MSDFGCLGERRKPSRLGSRLPDGRRDACAALSMDPPSGLGAHGHRYRAKRKKFNIEAIVFFVFNTFP